MKNKDRLIKVKPVFIDEGHKYESTLGLYTSVTTWLHEFEPYKNWDLIAAKYAEKHGQTQAYWLAAWKKAGVDACETGTAEHNKREAEVLGNEYYRFVSGKEVKTGDPVVAKRTLNLFELEDGLYPELLVWNNTVMISGQSDLVLIETILNKRWVTIIDYKTNKELKDYNYINKWTNKPVINSYFQFPVKLSRDYCECNYWKYQLQLNTYGWLLSQFGFHFNGGYIVHTRDNDRRYDLFDLQGDISKLMRHRLRNLKGIRK